MFTYTTNTLCSCHITASRDCCVQSCFTHPISSVFSPGCRLMWAAFSVGTVDAISLWNSKHRCNQPGGKQSSQITPGSSAAESSTGIAAFPLLMTAAKRQLLQQHQNIVAGVVVLLAHADWLIGRTSAACMSICTGICMLIYFSGGPAWSALVWTDWQA